MAGLQPRYSKEEFARRCDEIYERDIHPYLEAGNAGKFIAIDIDTGAYEIDTDELVASDRLLARYSDARVWLKRALVMLTGGLSSPNGSAQWCAVRTLQMLSQWKRDRE